MKPLRPILTLRVRGEHRLAFGQRRPAAALHEFVVCRLGRREGIGLVQKSANGDARAHGR